MCNTKYCYFKETLKEKKEAYRKELEHWEEYLKKVCFKKISLFEIVLVPSYYPLFIQKVLATF